MAKKLITLQKIFNAAWNHFIIGNGKPAVKNEVCAYIDDAGNRCAVGLVLTKKMCKQYPEMGFSYVVTKNKELFSKEINIMEDYELNRFQRYLHDNLVNNETRKWTFNKRERRKKYIELANKFNLKIPKKKVSDH